MHFCLWRCSLGYDSSAGRLPYSFLHALASIAQALVGLVNWARRLTHGPKTRPVLLTFSPSRLCIAATSHWYRIDSAQSELGYTPLWSLKEALYLTLRMNSDKRNPRPSPAALSKARRGNLVALGLVADPEASSKRSIGANDSFRDPSTLPEYTSSQVAEHNTRENLWLVINGFVYDLTAFVDNHPGGDVILSHAGADASVGFFGPQHPSHVTTTLEKYLIGRKTPE
jgi:cytochrome b involved in lipid metabolism